MKAKKGSRISVSSSKTGGAPRLGEVLELIETGTNVSYRVRWSDGHESLFAPAPGAATVTPDRGSSKKSSSKKSSSKKSSSKKSSSKKSSSKKSKE